jgi:Na+-transporting NADH:ubiquinone oxidoreductase subunit B
MSGDAVWTAAVNNGPVAVDAVTAATPLVVAATAPAVGTMESALGGAGYDLSTLFFGFYPDSIGASSTLLCMIGGGVLILHRRGQLPDHPGGHPGHPRHGLFA